MSSEKYIGLDVHQATISVAVMDSSGKVVMESILETKAATILEFFAGLRGALSVTFEEGTWAAWLYDLLKPHVAKLVVCNPRKNALLKHGNKSERIDAFNLADLLRLNRLESVYHGETSVRMLRELARSYLTIVSADGDDAIELPTIPAEFRNMARRVLCLSKNFELIFLRFPMWIAWSPNLYEAIAEHDPPRILPSWFQVAKQNPSRFLENA